MSRWHRSPRVDRLIALGGGGEPFGVADAESQLVLFEAYQNLCQETLGELLERLKKGRFRVVQIWKHWRDTQLNAYDFALHANCFDIAEKQEGSFIIEAVYHSSNVSFDPRHYKFEISSTFDVQLHDIIANLIFEVARPTAPKKMPNGDEPPPEAKPEKLTQDLTARGTPRKIAPKRSVAELKEPALGFGHPENSIQAQFASKADRDVVNRFNRFCKSAPGLKQDYVTEALKDFLAKHDHEID